MISPPRIATLTWWRSLSGSVILGAMLHPKANRSQGRAQTKSGSKRPRAHGHLARTRETGAPSRSQTQEGTS
ncbi:hypothetical protein VZT92_001217 [Zoarces viviparus]|uniref:Secreted protein n=1 Tax=Zoarces viviparus TaxID=48416 RepID=A0AAW1G3W9_ZOAVI